MKSKIFTLLLVVSTVIIQAQDGITCSTPIAVSELTQYTAAFDNCWYVFTAAEDGLHNITTCDIADCDTKIWVYDDCPPNELSENPEGALTYNDDFCGLQSNVNFVAHTGDVFLIRIGDYFDACTFPVDWAITNLGEIEGCIDPEMCNFNPLATTDDGSCISFDDPLCLGPDLLFDSDALVNSLMVLTHFADDCDVAEGCVTGYGNRQVITFSSKIDNIGQQDYYIGNSFTNPQMFNTENCHGHNHYEGYGDYKLVDMNGNIIPAGHKNGFCVMDLCGFGQYDCGDMGISAGCYDVYGAGTQCQWVDVTEIADGDYRLIAIVNPFYLPDAIGRMEENVINNMTTVCLHISHNGGEVSFELLDDCPEYVDCAGTVNGNAWPDCNGDCNGSAVFGDVAVNSELDTDDLTEYMNLLEEFPVPITSCNDLNASGHLTVYDIALNHYCQNANENGQDVLSSCNFPIDIVNDEVPCGLAISGVNLDEGWVEVEVTNTAQHVRGYQFSLSGIVISEVVSLLSDVDFNCQTGFNTGNNNVFVYSINEDFIEYGNVPKNICRVYFSNVTANEICITSIEDIVNSQYERTETYVYGECVTTVGISDWSGAGEGVVILPNPVNENTRIYIAAAGSTCNIYIHDELGREVMKGEAIQMNQWNSLDLSMLSIGVYTMSVQLQHGTVIKSKLVKD